MQVGRPLRGRDRLLALMDVGAMLCRPRAPRCEDCPLRRRCATRGPLPGETRPRQAAVRGQLPATTRAGDGPAARRRRRRWPSSTPTRSRPSSTTASRSSPAASARLPCPDRRRGSVQVRCGRRRGSSRARVPGFGEDRLGVELHALDRQVAVAQAHHQAVLRLGGDLEHVGDRRRARPPASGSGSR